MTRSPESVRSFHFSDERGVEINGEPFPYLVARQSPLMESIEDSGTHILWLPLLVDGAGPRAGRPDGEALENEEQR